MTWCTRRVLIVQSAIFIHLEVLTIGAVVVVLTAPYLSDSGGSGIITPLLFIKLTNQTNSENKTITDYMQLYTLTELTYTVWNERLNVCVWNVGV